MELYERNNSRMHARTQLSAWAWPQSQAMNNRQKYGRKHPWLGSAAYLSIIYLEYIRNHS